MSNEERMVTLSEEQYRLLKQWYDLKQQKTELTKQVEALDSQLEDLKKQIAKTVFQDQPGLTQLDGQLIKYAIIEASRIDTTKLKKEMPSVAKAFTVSYTYTTLSIVKN